MAEHAVHGNPGAVFTGWPLGGLSVDESGPFEIYVQPFPAASAKWQISTPGGTMPRWRADGQELFFIAPDEKVMAAAVTPSNTTFEAAPPVALFQTRILSGTSHSSNTNTRFRVTAAS